jgi:choline kinase
MRYNVVLMAGKGQRFLDADFVVPKPLLPVKGSMMFERSIENFPACDEWIFVINETINKHQKFQNFLDKFPVKFQVLTLSNLTNGQATSCYEAIKNLDENSSIFVGSCDTIFEKKLIIDELHNHNLIVYTSRPTRNQLDNSSSYGWVYQAKNSFKVFCKEKINKSDEMNILLGYFFFDKISTFKQGYNHINDHKLFVNNELYIDVIARELAKKQYKLTQEIVNSHVVGTPAEYRYYLTI